MMSPQNRTRYVMLGLASLFLMSSTPAFAYVEPGTGNLVLQLLFGGAAGIGLLLKLYWNKFWQPFARLKSARNRAENHPDPVQESETE